MADETLTRDPNRRTVVAGVDNSTGDIYMMRVDATTHRLLVDSNANVLEPAITITPYNKTLTSADTEYSQALTANTRGVRFRCRTLYDVRYAWVTGKVATPTAPYLTLPAGMDYFADGLDLTSKTLYLASAQAGVVVEIEEYT